VDHASVLANGHRRARRLRDTVAEGRTAYSIKYAGSRALTGQSRRCAPENCARRKAEEGTGLGGAPRLERRSRFGMAFRIWCRWLTDGRGTTRVSGSPGDLGPPRRLKPGQRQA